MYGSEGEDTPRANFLEKCVSRNSKRQSSFKKDTKVFSQMYKILIKLNLVWKCQWMKLSPQETYLIMRHCCYHTNWLSRYETRVKKRQKWTAVNKRANYSLAMIVHLEELQKNALVCPLWVGTNHAKDHRILALAIMTRAEPRVNEDRFRRLLLLTNHLITFGYLIGCSQHFPPHHQGGPADTRMDGYLTAVPISKVMPLGFK